MPNMAKKPTVGTLGTKLGMTGPLGNRPTLFGGRKKDEKDAEGGGLSVAEKIMQKYGHESGAGLGKMEQGMASPLEVEKTSRRGGKIIAGKAAFSPTPFRAQGEMPKPNTPAPPPNIRKLPNLSKPTKIVCLQNMVTRDEIDEDLAEEVTSECS